MSRLGKVSRAVLAFIVVGVGAPQAAELPSKASNYGSIANTRHNLTQSYLGGGAGWMNLSRNDYGEVCVYCHTPHGAGNVAAPLWNRTIKSTTYTTYDQLTSTLVEQTYSQPGAASLTCLTCHDGQTAIDSVINMPGSNRYLSTQATEQSTSFLDAWPGGPGSSFFGGHGTLSNSPATLGGYGECMSCHSPSGDQYDPNSTPNFDVFLIGTDLRNDHPVGVTYPSTNGPATEWQTPNGTRVVAGRTVKFFDTNSNGRMDKDELRLYDTGDGPEVECASCHDPHGVPSGGQGSPFNKSFLRKPNESSAVCLTCHAK